MRIVFHMLPEHGHLNPTFSLARALAKRGHEIIYTSFWDLRELIERRGHTFVPVHGDIVPKNRLTEIDQMSDGAAREAAWRRIRERVREEYLDGTVSAWLQEIAPAVVLADVILLSPLQFVAYRLGIPCIQLSTSLSQHHDSRPPITSALALDSSPAEREAARWESSCIRHLGLQGTPVADIMASELDLLSARFGYPADRVSFKSVFSPALDALPEIVLCARAFDFPSSTEPKSIHAASPVEIERNEDIPDGIRDFIDRARPLVYASLGSLGGRYEHGLRFFRAILEALSARPDWHAVVGVGPRYMDDPIFERCPSNVLLLSSAPQLWLLRRAAVFLTHGGLGGVREAIALGVPVIVVPQDHDQMGNAARVLHHQIGLHIPANVVTSANVATAIDDILRNAPLYRDRVKQLDEMGQREEQGDGGAEQIEQLAEQASATRAAGITALSSTSETAELNFRGWVFVKGHPNPNSSSTTPDARIYPDLAAALSRANASCLARVEVTNALRRGDGNAYVAERVDTLWVENMDQVLFAFAEWCAGEVLEARAAEAPEEVAFFKDLIRQAHKLRELGATFAERQTFYANAVSYAAPRWHQGYGAAAEAIHPKAHRAAQKTFFAAIQYSIRRLVGKAAGTKEGADLYEKNYGLVKTRFSAELERRVAEHTNHPRVVT